MIQKSPRLRELDFLRGFAIILILFRHQYLFEFTSNMGWIGVDLFFVLSGFLVSSLLFKEFLRYGKIRPARFLVRRGFKIYPIYYIFYLLYLIPMFLGGSFNLKFLLSDLTFTQNYVLGWGYAFPASWSLAVEEHFYIGLVVLLLFSLKRNWIKFEHNNPKTPPLSKFEIIVISSMILCFILRISSNVLYPDPLGKNFTMSHLRIDSLLSGVLVSYFFNFRREFTTTNIRKYKYLLTVTAILCLLWTPFIEPKFSIFAKTIGFTLLYLSFSILLLFFLSDENINQKLNNVFSNKVVNVISKIGYCSYSVYVIHTFVNWFISRNIILKYLGDNHYIIFIITSLISILSGMIMTYYIENYFLTLRDRYYPSKSLN